MSQLPDPMPAWQRHIVKDLVVDQKVETLVSLAPLGMTKQVELENACVTIAAREVHAEAVSVAQVFLGDIAGMGDAEAEVRLGELQELLAKLGVDKEDWHAIFGTAPPEAEPEPVEAGSVAAPGDEEHM